MGDVEIERKFLVASAAPQPRTRGEKIDQGYLVRDADAEVRLRRRAGTYSLTCKRGHGLVRNEWEIGITRSQFETLWPGTAQRRLSKVRYPLDLDGIPATVDVYEGEHEGLRVLEVEFGDETDALTFTAPEWCVAEITGHRGFENATLAVTDHARLRALLQAIGLDQGARTASLAVNGSEVDNG